MGPLEIRIRPTSRTIELDTGTGCVEARIWEGETCETGIEVHCFVTRIAVKADADQRAFEEQLVPKAPPSPAVAHLPARLVL